MENQIFSSNKDLQKDYSANNIISNNKLFEYSENIKKHRISIAPMLNITDNYFRSFIRLLTQNAVLYTEMIHTDTITHSFRGYLKELYFEQNQHPVVIQLGGNNPDNLGSVAKLCKEVGYDEINLNCGCPSSKVQECNFGAKLMENPDLVSECVNSIRRNSNSETTVKCRLGLNIFDQKFIENFIENVSLKGSVKHFIIHSRIAIMSLDTEKNRKIPPLQYEKVFELKRKFPLLNFSLNGGVKSLEEANNLIKQRDLFDKNISLKTNDLSDYKNIEKSFENLNMNDENGFIRELDICIAGCMIGRASYENPWILSNIDKLIYGKKNLGYSKKEVVMKYAEFVDEKGQQLNDKIEDLQYNYLRMVKPLTFLFPSERGTNQFKRDLVKINKNDRNFSIYDHILNSFEIFEKTNPQAVEVMPSDIN